MLIGILSDTHDQIARTARAVRLLADRGAEALFHCGDLTTPDVVYECAEMTSYFVLGNNDADEGGLRRAVQAIGGTWLGRGGEVSLGGRRIAVAHGDSALVIRRLLAGGPDYLLFGHTHQPTDERHGSTRWINPGALHRAANWTVALLDLESDDAMFLKLDKG